MEAVMGQSMKKMRQRTAVEKRSSQDLESKTHEFDAESDSEDWVTEIPTRSSSFFSDLTGNSTTDTGTTGSSFTSGTGYTSQETTNTADTTGTVPSHQKQRNSRPVTSTSSRSSNTSADHPPLERLEDSDVEFSRHSRSDEAWQLKVNYFLQHDPIHPRIRKPKRAKYVIKRHHLYVDPEAGKRWKNQIVRFIARIRPKVSNVIPITESDA
uniref:Uncharacterized protein n=1 Tax=Panagrolaimus sp. JU765 TaxID=591449 RepID=A0AC34QQ09_9BILA